MRDSCRPNCDGSRILVLLGAPPAAETVTGPTLLREIPPKTGTWLADSLARTLEVLRLEGGLWTILAIHAGIEIVRAEPFDAVELELGLLWASMPERP